MSEQNERQFKGVWIEADVWLNKDLSWMEKCLLAEINCLDHKTRGCTASNGYLAEMFHTSTASIANMLSRLRAGGHLENVTFNGRNRSMRVKAALTWGLTLPSPVGEPCLNPQVNHEPPPIVQQRKDEEEVTAEEVYSVYPNKVGRPVALAAIRKASARGTAMAVLLERTKAFAAARNGDKFCCPHPSTWFNQERYNDDPDTWKPQDFKRRPEPEPEFRL